MFVNHIFTVDAAAWQPSPWPKTCWHPKRSSRATLASSFARSHRFADLDPCCQVLRPVYPAIQAYLIAWNEANSLHSRGFCSVVLYMQMSPGMAYDWSNRSLQLRFARFDHTWATLPYIKVRSLGSHEKKKCVPVYWILQCQTMISWWCAFLRNFRIPYWSFFQFAETNSLLVRWNSVYLFIARNGAGLHMGRSLPLVLL